MSQAVVLCDVPPAVAERIVQSLPAGSVAVVRGHAARALEERGLDFVPWDAFIPEQLGKTLSRELARMSQGIEKALLDPGLSRSFDTDRGNVLPLIADDLRQTTLESAGAQISAIEVFDQITGVHRVSAVLFGGEPDAVQLALRARAGAHQISTLQLVEGVRPDLEALLPEVDHCLVW